MLNRLQAMAYGFDVPQPDSSAAWASVKLAGMPVTSIEACAAGAMAAMKSAFVMADAPLIEGRTAAERGGNGVGTVCAYHRDYGGVEAEIRLTGVSSRWNAYGGRCARRAPRASQIRLICRASATCTSPVVLRTRQIVRSWICGVNTRVIRATLARADNPSVMVRRSNSARITRLRSTVSARLHKGTVNGALPKNDNNFCAASRPMSSAMRSRLLSLL